MEQNKPSDGRKGDELPDEMPKLGSRNNSISAFLSVGNATPPPNLTSGPSLDLTKLKREDPE